MFIDLTETRGRQPGPFPANRRCAHPRCITMLCTWHGGDLCYQHELNVIPLPRPSIEDLMGSAA